MGQQGFEYLAKKYKISYVIKYQRKKIVKRQLLNQMQGEQDLCSYLKTNFEHKNRDQYLELIRQTISAQTPEQQPDLQPIIQEYASQYRNFMHNFNFTAQNKANALIEEALNNVHPGLKTKKECKVVLAIVAKIFCQELIEECVEVKEQAKIGVKAGGKVNGEVAREAQLSNNKKMERQLVEIDTDVVEEAYRRRLMKRQAI